MKLKLTFGSSVTNLIYELMKLNDNGSLVSYEIICSK